jgi:hypothetical protein
MYYFMRKMDSNMDLVLHKLSKLEKNMSIVSEALKAAHAEQDLIVAAVTSINTMVASIQASLANGDTEAASALLAEIQVNSEALVAATLAGTDAAHLVDPVVAAQVAEAVAAE